MQKQDAELIRLGRRQVYLAEQARKEGSGSGSEIEEEEEEKKGLGKIRERGKRPRGMMRYWERMTRIQDRMRTRT
jgi:hypothetical protein